jgi:hypothetical protein
LAGDRSPKKSASYDLRFKDQTNPMDPEAEGETPLTNKRKKTNILKTGASGAKTKDGKNMPTSNNLDKPLLVMQTIQETHADKFESYVNFFDKIFQETQLNDIDEVIRTYHESEGHNEKLYEEVTSLGNEVSITL